VPFCGTERAVTRDAVLRRRPPPPYCRITTIDCDLDAVGAKEFGPAALGGRTGRFHSGGGQCDCVGSIDSSARLSQRQQICRTDSGLITAGQKAHAWYSN